MTKLVIFDLDGTLVNAYPAVSQSVNYTLTQLGFPKRSHAEIKRSVGGGDRSLMAKFVGEKLVDQAIAIYRPHHTKALQAKGGVRFLPGAEATLKFLKANGYKMAIATNRPTKFTRLILKVLESRIYFNGVLCADRTKKPKPDPDILLTLIKSLKVGKKETLYVGDMDIDVHCGRRAGIRTVAVATGSSSLKELNKLKPYRIIARIGEIRTIL